MTHSQRSEFLPARLSMPALTRLAAACGAALAMAFAPTVFAQNAPAAGTAETASNTSRGPELNLQAGASTEVKQDTVRITLAVELEAADQATVGKRLSAALDDVVKRAKDAKGVEVRSGGYNVWPNSSSKGKITNWRGQGQIILESKDFEAASDLASKLGDKTAIANIQFLLSREAREAEERKLLTQAANAFRERALAASTAFGFKGYQLSKIDLSGGGEVPMPRMPAPMMMAKDSAEGAAGVPLEAGEVTVSVTVSGTIVLQ